MEAKNTTEFLEEFEEKLQDEDFVKKYEDNHDSIINDYKGFHPRFKNLAIINFLGDLTDEDKIIEEQMKNDLVNTKYGDGFISMSLLYAVFSLANFASAAIVKIIGHKMTMV